VTRRIAAAEIIVRQAEENLGASEAPDLKPDEVATVRDLYGHDFYL
jgi:hypothetical protein